MQRLKNMLRMGMPRMWRGTGQCGWRYSHVTEAAERLDATSAMQSAAVLPG